MAPANKHSRIEDAQAMVLGVFLCAAGLHILTDAALLTGQTAGIAVILSYVSGWAFGPIFFVINLPFYWLAWRRLGPEFTVKSLLSVTLLSIMSATLPQFWQVGDMARPLAALLFGAITGTGLLVLFRHNGSLGGMGVLALLIQDTTGFRAGYVQLIADVIIFAVGLILFSWQVVVWSLLGSVIVNLIIAVNHRRDRYIAT